MSWNEDGRARLMTTPAEGDCSMLLQRTRNAKLAARVLAWSCSSVNSPESELAVKAAES